MRGIGIFTLVAVGGCSAAAVTIEVPAVTIPPAAEPAPGAPVAEATARPSSSTTSAESIQAELAQLDVAMLGSLRSGDMAGANGGGLVGAGGVTYPPVAAAAVQGPQGQATIGGWSVKGGRVANAGAVVAGMRAGFRRCFNKGLQSDASMKGSVTLEARLGPNGEVLGVSPTGGTGLSGTVVACVAARVASAQFAPPDQGSPFVSIPITFDLAP